VQASQNEPLVTEWPASEKSHLESLIARGGVAVSYSGCEMRVLSACAVKGSYAFQKTTLATDSLEIQNEDDLYAKLPLGAVSLAGDLERAGRLAVRTSVAGQYALKDATPLDVASEGECANATHLVTGLSIGAFKLIAGGKAKASAGVSAGSAGAGATHTEEEATLREAGDPSKCAQTGDTPQPECRSPIQVFLQKIPHREAAAGPSRQGMEEDKPPPNAVRVNFQPDAAEHHWSLLTREGKLVCDLPCSRWVAPNSGYKVQLDADRKDDIKLVSVPDDLGYSAGRTVDAVPRPANNRQTPGLVTTIVGGVLAVGGATFTAVVLNTRPQPGPAVGGSAAAVDVIGVATLITGIWLLSSSQSSPTLDVSLRQ
jgi:hypothetical protein